MLCDRFMKQPLLAGWHCRCRSGLTTDTSEPEPDVALVRGGARDYLAAHPGPHDVGLVVEVADASVKAHRDLKERVYARAGIPVYWLINLSGGRLAWCSDPTGPDPNPAYRQRQNLGPADSVPLVLDGREVFRIPVRDLLP
jgi:Uma2 family endonuclease